MSRRIAVTFSLIAFALCVCQGIAADNTFTTVVSKALVAMVVTLVVGLVIGAMAQKMLDENMALEEKKLESLKVSATGPGESNAVTQAGKPAMQMK